MDSDMHLTDRIGRRIKLQDVHILMTVAQAGSMGKAALQLNSSQPAVSRSIAELEQVLGVRLLDRHRRGIELTVYGRAFLECGAAAFDDLRRGVKDIEVLADPSAGEVRIGTNANLGGSVVSAIIDRQSRRHPRVVFRLLILDPKSLHRELIDRNVDLLISQKYDQLEDEQLEFETLYNASYAVAAGAQHPWARRRRFNLSDLADEPWVLPPPESPVGSIVTKAFRAAGTAYPRATVFVAEASVRISLLSAGRFLTIVATSLLRFPIKRAEVKILPVELPVIRAPIGIVTLKGRTLGAVAKRFIESAREVTKPLARGNL
jgi:DNA-binding transcriptional LysR family regulator